MAPPVWPGLAKVDRQQKYLDYGDHEWAITNSLLWDPQAHLFFRDNSYFDRREKNGRKTGPMGTAGSWEVGFGYWRNACKGSPSATHMKQNSKTLPAEGGVTFSPSGLHPEPTHRARGSSSVFAPGAFLVAGEEVEEIASHVRDSAAHSESKIPPVTLEQIPRTSEIGASEVSADDQQD